MTKAQIIPVDPTTFELEEYSVADENLISSVEIGTLFNPSTDYIEYFIYNPNNGGLVFPPSEVSPNYTDYTLEDNILSINPESDLNSRGYLEGNYNTFYNFLSTKLASNFNQRYYISEISSDRTEIRLDSNIISAENIISSSLEYIQERDADEFYPDFYLNFGSNQLVIANNILLDTDTVLIKLYEPLPSQYQLKDTLWVVEQIAEPIAYLVELVNLPIIVDNSIRLKGPNLNVKVKGQINNSTEATNFNTLVETGVTSSLQQINSFYDDPSVQINVDYTEFSNFIKFSSAEKRINNFFYKIQQIENWTDSAQSGSNVNLNSTSGSTAYYQNLINETIDQFDNYEYFLYFTSGSKSYPKTNTTKPYDQSDSTSVLAQTWITSSLTDASTYDENNQDWVYYAIPEYLREDPSNQSYLDFTNMVGHFYDENIWVYIKDITNKWDSDNRIDSGISRDLIAQQLRDLGFNIYENQFSSFNLFVSTLGLTPSGSYFPFPYMTGSLPTPSGFEYVNASITGSNEILPQDDVNKRLYKRIYNNLSYLYKKKGTVDGIRTLATIYGIPNTLLRIDEFGGKDKTNVNDWDYWFEQFNYKYESTGDAYIATTWSLDPGWGSSEDRPETVEFRFKSLPADVSLPRSQSLWSLDDGRQVKAVLEYDTDLLTSASFSGSIPNPTYQSGSLRFTTDNFATSTVISLPFLNGDWWNVSITRDEPDNYTLRAANSLYSGSNGSSLGWEASSSFVAADEAAWITGEKSYFPSLDRNDIDTYVAFTGSYQEIRYYNTALNSQSFFDHTMNPQSFEGNSINSAPDELAFRATLGGELFTGSLSMHPKVSGSWVSQSSFRPDNSSFNLEGTSVFSANREYVLMDQPAVGIKNRITDKIRQVALNLPEGSQQLSNIRSIQQNTETDDAYTNTVNQVEVVLSPTNQINDDIISSIGYFNIGEYIGDPRQINSGSTFYPDLNDLRDDYFLKYTSNYDWNDFIRLIKFFDNSLWKIIKDFIPAKISSATGISIKQHLLERQKYPQPSASYSEPSYTGSIGSIPYLLDGERAYSSSLDNQSFPIEAITGSTGGSFVQLNAISASLTSGGSGYKTPVSNYSVTTTGGGGSGLVISIDSIDENFRLSGGKDLVGSITQTSNDYNPGTYGGTYTTSPSGVSVQLANQVDGLGVPNLILVVVNTANGVEVGDTITIPSGDFGSGTLDVIITLQSSDLTSTGGPINGITLVDGGSGYTSVPTLTINGSPGSGADIDLSLISQQNWGGSYTTPFGHIPFTQNTDKEFFNGELSGSTIIATTGSLSNPTVTQRLLFQQQARINERSPILFDFNSDVSYQLIIKALNDSGGTYTFSITDANNDGYTLYTSPSITGGNEFIVNLNIEDFSINGKNLITPRVSFLPNSSGNFFAYTASIYENVLSDPDNQALLNNDVVARRSNIFWDLDYSSNAIQAVNQQAVITASQQDGNLPKAFVQDYNWYSTPILRRNYAGAKSTSPGFNQNSTSGGFGVLPNVELLNVAAYSVNFGGGTSPEILGLGGTSLSDILLVDGKKEDVTIVAQADPNYSDIINTSLEPGDIISFYQQGSNSANIPQRLEVVETKANVPTKSSYMIPSDTGAVRATFIDNALNGTEPGIEFSTGTPGVYEVELNNSGQYISGSFIDATTFISDFQDIFNNSQNDWYVSVYTKLGSPVVYSGSEATVKYEFTPDFTVSDPFGYYGVSKILGVDPTGGAGIGPNIYIDRELVAPLLNSNIGNGSYGILIWESWGNSIIVRGSNLSGLGASLAYSQFAPKELTENLEYISRTYTNKS